MLIKAEGFLLRFGFAIASPFEIDGGVVKKYGFRIEDEKGESVIVLKTENADIVKGLIEHIHSGIQFAQRGGNSLPRHPKTGEYVLDITGILKSISPSVSDIEYLRLNKGTRAVRVSFGTGDVALVQKELKKVKDTGGVYVRLDNGVVKLKKREITLSAVNMNYANREKGTEGLYRTHAYIKLPYTKDRFLVTIQSKEGHTKHEVAGVEKMIYNDFNSREVIMFSPQEMNIKLRSVTGLEVRFHYLPEKRKWVLNATNNTIEIR